MGWDINAGLRHVDNVEAGPLLVEVCCAGDHFQAIFPIPMGSKKVAYQQLYFGFHSNTSFCAPNISRLVNFLKLRRSYCTAVVISELVVVSMK